MVPNWDEKRPLEAARRCPTSTLVLLLLVGAVSLSYNLLSTPLDADEDWSCPSCPRPALNYAAGKPPAPTPTLPPGPTTLSHLVFAIGASATTWERRRAYAELWWDPATVRGHAWLDRDPGPLPPCAACPPVGISPAAADVASRFGDRASASRIARIVADAHSLRLPDVRWFVMGDDDTVFFKDNLVAVLNKYDHNEMYYVGSPSESVEQDVMHSYGMAFGGGGFAISAPAARELAGAIDGCLDRYRTFWGSDQRVQACLAEIGVPLTREPGFHQVDLRGDVYGLLAAHPVAPLVSLHHLDNVKPISPLASTQLGGLKTLVRAAEADPGRVLQQAFCYVVSRGYNWSVAVAWGYTAQIYPWVLTPSQLEVPLQTFQTWRSFKDGPFTFNTRPFRPDRDCERPVRFFLDRVRALGEEMGNVTVTEYSRFEPEEEEKRKGCERAGFVEAAKVRRVRVISGRLDGNFWQKAPRRQCCETRRVQQGTVMEVRVRSCYAGEITTPP